MEDAKKPITENSAVSEKYDIIFSLAGEQKYTGQRIKDYLASKGISCWIYTEREFELVGSNQPAYLQDLFITKADFCVIIISADYIRKKWTGLEGKYILSKWMKKDDFLIPVQYEDSPLPGLPDTVGYISWNHRHESEIAEVILEILRYRGRRT